MIRQFLFSIFPLMIAVFLQTTVLSRMEVFLFSKPDLVMIVLILTSLRKGKMIGQTAGFCSGFVEDLLSVASPLGFNAIIKTIIGFSYGMIRDSISLGYFIAPFLIGLITTILKILFQAFLIFFFSINKSFNIFSLKVLLEIPYNALLCPILFALFNLLSFYKPVKRGFNG